MKDREIETVNIFLDASNIEIKLDRLSIGIDSIRTSMGLMHQFVLHGFSSNKTALQEVSLGVNCLSAALAANTSGIVKELGAGLAGIVDELKEILSAVIGIEDKLAEIDKNGKAANTIQAFSTIGQLLKNENGSDTKKGTTISKTGKEKTLALPGPAASEDSGKSGGNDSAVSGLVSGAFAGGGDFSSMLPDGEMLQSLGELTAKLKESAAAWLTQTGAKIADKAVDLQIMALYALDYVKAFGAMIAQIAASTAAWIANTAVKVANTAAQWAQIAATTAWNALCAVATTVTTAQ